MISIRPVTLMMLVALALLPAMARPALAQDDPDIVDDVPQANQENVVDFQVNDATFDQWVFGQSMQIANASSARVRIDSSLDLQINSLNEVAPITEAQKKKLRLAGRGDIKRFFDRVEEKRARFNLVKKDRNRFGEFYQEVVPLQASLSMGLFREGSLFSKTVQSTLDEAQAVSYLKSQEERRAFRWRAKVELVSDMWAGALGLDDGRRRKLVELILSEVPAPMSFGQLDYYFVMYKLSRIPRAKLRPIFEDGQWKMFDRQVNQARGFQSFLSQQGYSREDIADPEPKPEPKAEEKKK